jgi:hypothetical protein
MTVDQTFIDFALATATPNGVRKRPARPALPA